MIEVLGVFLMPILWECTGNKKLLNDDIVVYANKNDDNNANEKELEESDLSLPLINLFKPWRTFISLKVIANISE